MDLKLKRLLKQLSSYTESDLDKLQQHAAAGFGNALVELGRRYEEGNGLTQNPTKAFQNYNAAAATENAEGLYHVARSYLNAIGTSKDEAKALKYHKQAAQRGHIEAAYHVGQAYIFARVVSRDLETAETWYRKAAEQGHSLAQYQMGQLAHHNNAESEAFQWYLKSANGGYVESMYAVAQRYIEGTGVAKDARQCVSWLETASAQDSGAGVILGNMYKHGELIARDYVKAVRWYRTSANSGNIEAMANLSECLGNGWGVTKDKDEALKWDLKVVESGNQKYGPVSINNICGYYYLGWGSQPINYQTALKWIQRGIDDYDSSYSKAWLGMCYQNGTGVTKNFARARQLYREALNQGVTSEQMWRDKLKQVGG